MIVCQTPIKDDRYDFRFKHLDCDCIADISQEEKTKKVLIIAYSETKSDNRKLRDYYANQSFGDNYVILKGIDSAEANSIGCF